ncbi:MAG: CinA family protein [Oscillospiraceae bacterium]|nr:CinA family protein [Oscillospiraceae bacterium]
MLEELAKKAVSLLKEQNKKIAVAESCTGGLVSKLITDIDGASRVFECGVVAYANPIKSRLLSVSENTLEKYGAVSEETVCGMANGVRLLAGADIGLAVSGIAGPASDNTDKPVGLIYLALCDENKIKTVKLQNKFTEDVRKNNRESAALEALNLIISHLCIVN